jgi:NADH dehydrogenase FAD-containing subunit
MASTTPTHVVIIGGSFGGLGLANKLLETPSIKVTLINPSDSFYFNIAAPRILAKPATPIEKVLLPIANTFKGKKNFEFVLGSVTSVDFEAKSVSVGAGETISYDYLVIASGSTTPETKEAGGLPFKETGSNDLKASIEKAQKQIADAKTIIIGGGGTVGVETSGEIKEAYPETKVTLIHGGSRVLDFLKESASKAAAANLKGLGVEIVTGTKVQDAKRVEGGWQVTTSDGKTLKADLYISALGVVPNSSFLPKQILDEAGWVKVSPKLEVEGAKDVFAIGDITTFKARYASKTIDMVPILAGNLKAVIAGGAAATEYKGNEKVIAFVPTGSKSGTGQMGGFVVWSWMVVMAKAKGYLIDKAASFIGVK